MIRSLLLCRRAIVGGLLAGAFCSGPASFEVYAVPPSSQPSRVTAIEQPGDSVGYTYLDLQTQQSMPERLVYNPETGIVQMVWMADAALPVGNLRGTYFAAIDAGKPEPEVLDLPFGWQRIEGRKSAWPSIAAFADGSIGVASHTPLLFTKNLPGSYTAFTTEQTNTDGAVYMRTAIDGSDNVHLIFSYSGGAHAGQIGYVRSSDRGQTWSEPVRLTGSQAPGGMVPGVAGFDCYAIAARGAKVVVLYADKQLRLWQRVSLTSGETWEDATVLYEPQRTYQIVERLEGDTVRFVSDTVATAGTQMDVIIDGEGATHCVFSMIATAVQGKGLETDGTVTSIGLDTLVLDTEQFRTLGLGYIAEGKAGVVQMGPPAGGQWDGMGTFLSNGGLGFGVGAGYSCYPQLGVDSSNAVYCVYTSVQNGDMQPVTVTLNGSQVTVDGLFGHLYITHMQPGAAWSTPVNLTPAGLDCLYGTLANTVDDKLYIGYQSDSTPGIAAIHKTPAEPTVVRFRALAVQDLTGSVSVDPHQPYEERASTLVITPNPVLHTGYIAFHVPASAEITVELYTVTGTKVSTVFRGMLEAGMHTVALDGRTVPTGQYYCIVRGQGSIQSGIISVIR